MTDKLLPCPFCGGNDIQIDEMESFWDKNETSWRVLCIDCIAETAGDTKEQAIAAWNRRAEPENKPLTLNELKQMVGEPIWVVTLDGTDEPRREIVVFAGKYGIDLICVLNGVETSDYADYDLYNDTWLAYRNKPVKEEHHETDRRELC